MDAITLLKSDHQKVQKLFRTFEQAGERAHATKAKTAAAIVRELTRHAAIEEQIFYPAVRHDVPEVAGEVLESLEEHHVVKWLCSEIDKMTPQDERFTAKVTVLIENVRHHVKEEEGELFPAVRRALGRKQLAELGDSMDKAKLLAPTRPRPRSADTPPANLFSGVTAGMVDKARDRGAKAIADARHKVR
ncbi:MAG TPA: hemerythrin domain-containing protein [Acidimicrobiales bacterium]|jgi:hemerythrin superfamily protein